MTDLAVIEKALGAQQEEIKKAFEAQREEIQKTGQVNKELQTDIAKLNEELQKSGTRLFDLEQKLGIAPPKIIFKSLFRKKQLKKLQSLGMVAHLKQKLVLFIKR